MDEVTIEDIKRLELSPDDILVVSIPMNNIPNHRFKEMCNKVKEQFNGFIKNEIIIIPKEYGLTVLGKTE